MLERTLELTSPLSIPQTLGPLRHGQFDPCTIVSLKEAWRASNTPEGPGTLRIFLQNDSLLLTSWGPGAGWLLDTADTLLGLDVPRPELEHKNKLIKELSRTKPGMRVPRTNAVFESMVTAILEQRVTGLEAKRSYRQMTTSLSEPAPGPPTSRLMLPIAPERIADTPAWAFHRFGVERKRAEALRTAARHSKRLEEATQLSRDDAMKRLTALPGLGPWTAAEVAYVALGNSDAVSVGDYHIKNYVSWALAGEPRGTDDRMMELLDPFSPHRGWVARLIMASGVRPPKFGPRYNPLPISTL